MDVANSSAGYQFDISLIERVGITPIKIANQATLNGKEEVIRKKRITHDCSRPGASGFSINNRVDEILLEECRFGLCLLRILYQIHHLKVENPETRVLISKFGFDAAYRKQHVLLKMALLCTTILLHTTSSYSCLNPHQQQDVSVYSMSIL